MDSVYKIIEIVGTSESSWEDAAKTALDTAANTIQDLRIAEVNKLDIKIDEQGGLVFRAKLNVSFKYRS
jgi:flavin-binding protein dodecin